MSVEIGESFPNEQFIKVKVFARVSVIFIELLLKFKFSN